MSLSSFSGIIILTSFSEYALHKMHGYGIAPRKPLLPLKEPQGEAFMLALKELLELEAELAVI